MKTYTIQALQSWIMMVVFLSAAFLALGCDLLFTNNTIGTVVWCLIWGALGYYTVKKIAVRELHVILTAEALAVQSTSAKERQILLSQVASYLYQKGANGKVFRMRLYSGEKISFNHSDVFCKKDDMQALVTDFEGQRLGQGQQLTFLDNIEGKPAISILREKTFFENPVGNVLGWLILVVLVYFSWHLLTHGVDPKKPAAPFMIYGNGLAYLGAWWNARRTKNV